MELKQIETLTQNWYWYNGEDRTVPALKSRDFASLVGGTLSLAYEVCPIGLRGGKIKMGLDDKVETAYADLKNRKIVVGTPLFSEEFLSQMCPDHRPDGGWEWLALAAINGTIIHEALHLRYTPTEPAEWVEGAIKYHLINFSGARYTEMVDKYGEAAVFRAFNIVEDLYIESKPEGALDMWVEAADDIIFQPWQLDDIKNPTKDLNDFLNLAVVFKNRNLRDNEIFDTVPGMKEVLESAWGYGCDDIRSRVRTTYTLLELFDIEAAEKDGKSQKSGEAGASSKKGKREMTDAVEKLAEALEEMEVGEFVEKTRDLSSASDKISKAVAGGGRFIGSTGEAAWHKLIEVDVFEAGTTTREIKPKCKEDYQFMKMLKAMRTLNRVPGVARTSGAVMVKSRLSRIATDGKIFAKKDANRERMDRVEIIINVDFSASTYGEVINRELGSAMAISKVLREAGIAHSVYGHTSTGGDIPYAVRIFSYDMQTTDPNLEERFERACHVPLEQNYDGVVINHLAKRFTGKQAIRHMINLSDGSPAGPGYSGTPAREHTKSEIEKARLEGIKVWCISVVSGVVDHNNQLYGQEYNLGATYNLQAEFEGMIKRLVGG